LRFPGKLIFVEKTSDTFPYPNDVLIISDSGNNRIVIIDETTYECVDVIGKGGPEYGHEDGTFKECRFYHPQGTCHFIDKVTGDHILLVCDVKNHLLREVNLNKKSVKTVSGKAEVRGNDRSGGLPGTEQELASPWDIVQLDEDNFIIAIAGNH
jgi:hypothetical protein